MTPVPSLLPSLETDIGLLIYGFLGLGLLVAAVLHTRNRDVVRMYLALAEASPEIVYITNREGDCIAVNRRWHETTGQAAVVAAGNGYRDIMHPRDLQIITHAWEAARNTWRSHEHQIRLRMLDGTYEWHFLRIIPIRDHRGKTVAWMGTASNIDGQVRAVESMRFLANAGEAISSSLDMHDNLSSLSQVATGAFSDCSAVWTKLPDEPAKLVAFTHIDADVQKAVERLMHSRFAPTPCRFVKSVLDGGGPVFEPDINKIDEPTRTAWSPVDVQSFIIVPLDAGAEIFGCLVLGRTAKSRRFSAHDIDIAVALAKRAGSAMANTFMFEASRTLAKSLQSAFLPPFLPELDGIGFEAVYRPAALDAQVGGDWYDVFPLRDGRVALSIGDIMGHGVAAATAMVRLRETIRAAAASFDADPQAVLAFANRAMCSSEGNGLATAVFAVYDARTARLDYAVAGHPKPLLVRGETCTELARSSGMVLGIDPEARCNVGTATLTVGDRLVLFTDGLIECDRDVFAGEQRLRTAMCAHESAETVVDSLLGSGQSDDVALLMMSISSAVIGEDGSSGWRFHSDDAASATSARASFSSYLAWRGVDGEAIEIAELVFGELVSNVVRHAPGPIDIDVRFDAAVPILTVGDRGKGLFYQPGRAHLPEDILAESGRGLFLIERLAAELNVVSRRGGGTEISVPLRYAAATREASLV